MNSDHVSIFSILKTNEIRDSISDAKLLSEYESFALLEIAPPALAPPNPNPPSAQESSTVPAPPSLAARPRVGYPTKDQSWALQAK